MVKKKKKKKKKKEKNGRFSLLFVQHKYVLKVKFRASKSNTLETTLRRNTLPRFQIYSSSADRK